MCKAPPSMLKLQNKAELGSGLPVLTVQTPLMMEGPTVCFCQMARDRRGLWSCLLAHSLGNLQTLQPSMRPAGFPQLPLLPAGFPTSGNGTATHQVLRPDTWVSAAVPSSSLPSSPPGCSPSAAPVMFISQTYFESLWCSLISFPSLSRPAALYLEPMSAPHWSSRACPSQHYPTQQARANFLRGSPCPHDSTTRNWLPQLPRDRESNPSGWAGSRSQLHSGLAPFQPPSASGHLFPLSP